MRALTVEELGFVSGGNHSPGGSPWFQLGNTEVVIVMGYGSGGGGSSTVGDNSPSAFDSAGTAYRRMGEFWGGLNNSQRGAILGGALVAVGGGLMLAATLTPVGALVWGIMAISTAQTLGYGLITVGGVAAISGTVADAWSSR